MKKLYKPIILIFTLVAASVATIFSVLLGNSDSNADAYLDASNFIESPESKEFRQSTASIQDNKNPIENSFLASSFDNLSLYDYEPGEGGLVSKRESDGSIVDVPSIQKYESANNSKFSGNIDSYNKVINDATNIQLGNDDFAIVNLVIKTKNDFAIGDQIKVDIQNDDPNLTIQTGFLRNIVANSSRLQKNGYIQSGIKKDLIVPDGVTDDQTTDMVKNKVYVYRIRIDRKNDDNPNETYQKLSVKVEIKNNNRLLYEDKKQINITKINKTVPGVNDSINKNENGKNPSFNVLDYANSLAYFYNNYGHNKNDVDHFYHYKGRVRNEPGICPPYLLDNSFDKNDMNAYIEGNGNHYGEPEFKNQFSNLGMGSYFVVNFSHDDNHLDSGEIDNKTDQERGNLGDEDRDGNSYYVGKINEKGVYLDDDDWSTTDNYINRMGSLGFRNLVLNNLLKMFYYKQMFYVGDKNNNKWVIKGLSTDPKDDSSKGDEFGYELPTSKEIVEQIIVAGAKHIKGLQSDKCNSRYNGIKNYEGINSSFYIDEADNKDIKAILNIMEDVKKKYPDLSDYLKLNVAYPIRFMNDKNGSGTDMIKDVDILYLYTSSLYTDGNKRVQDLISYRNQHNLVTGMYQLNSSANNDMLRADPGILAYEMLLLNKQNEPNYMKYNIARGNSADNYGSGSYWEPEGYDVPYTSGDVVGEYPNINSVDLNGNRKSEDELDKEFEKYGEKGAKIKPIISTRLEGLALGVQMVKKIQILEKEKRIRTTDVNNLISTILTGSVIQSGNKFNFDSNKGGISIKTDSFGISYIDDYLKQKKSSVGQVDSTKEISNLINSASSASYSYGRGEK